MLTNSQWSLLAVALGVQFAVGVLGLVSSALTARDFYYASTLSMAVATGVLASAASGWAVLTGLVGVGFAAGAVTEPGRRRRHKFLVRQYHNLKGRSRP